MYYGTKQKLAVRGQVMTIAEWSKRSGLSPVAIYQRLRSGYTAEEAVKVKPKYGYGVWNRLFGGRRFEIDGIEDSILGHVRRRGLSYRTVRWRMQKGMTLEEALKNGRPRKTYTVDGISDTVEGHCKRLGLSIHTVHKRLYHNRWSAEKAFMPSMRGGKRRAGA